MKRLVVIFVIGFAAACSSEHKPDPPDLARRKAECRKLDEHIFRISPDSHLEGLPEAEQQKLIEQFIAKRPVEDLEQCAAADSQVIECMQKAPDTAAVRTCIPPPKKG